MTNKLLQVLLKFSLDKTSTKAAINDYESIEKALDKIDKGTVSTRKHVDLLGTDFAKFTKNFNSRFKVVGQKLVDVRTGIKATASDIRNFSKPGIIQPTIASIEEMGDVLRQDQVEAKAMGKEIAAIAKLANVSEQAVENMSDETYALSQNALQAENNFKNINKEAAHLTKVSQSIGRIGVGALAIGGGIAGAIFGSAKLYANELKEAGELGDETAQRWVAANEEIEDSFKNIGKEALTTVLPVLEKAVELARKAADFVEANPEVIKTALNVGLVTATLGAIGIAVSKGIKLVADTATLIASAQNLAAGKLMEAAARKNLAASLAATKGAGVAAIVTPATIKTVIAGAATKIGAGLVLGIAAYIGAQGGVALGNAINRKIYGDDVKDQDIGDAFETYRRTLSLMVTGFAGGLERIGLASDGTKNKVFAASKSVLKLGESAAKADEEVSKISTSKLESAVKASVTLSNEELKSKQKYNEDLAKIVRDTAKKLSSAKSALESALSSAAQSLNNSIRNITQNFTTQSTNAAQDYSDKRQDIIKDGNDDIQKIEQDHKERQRQLLIDHNSNVAQLVDDRDALGLAREEERYELERSEEERAANLSIAQKNADIAKRLQDEARSYAIERAQRLAQYQQDLKEANIRYKQSVEKARQQHKKRIEEIKTEEVERIAELTNARNKERQLRIDAYKAEYGDLVKQLQAERELKQQAYRAMGEDLIAFTNALSNSQSSSTLPGKAAGGYFTKSVRVAENGKEEFVLNNSATRAAEALLGGRITQQSLINSMRKNITLNDQRRYDSRVSAADRNEIRRDSQDSLIGVLSD